MVQERSGDLQKKGKGKKIYIGGWNQIVLCQQKLQHLVNIAFRESVSFGSAVKRLRKLLISGEFLSLHNLGCTLDPKY